jgi:prepilin-type N-terminal cleavage/methylation domain-containing protein
MSFPRTNAKMEMRRRHAFTLIELLVVIVILAILAGLSFPVFQSVQNAAKKAQAKNDLNQIVTALTAFYTEYGKYPVPAGNTDDGYVIGGNGTSSGPVMRALRGLDPTLNPRQIVFLNPAEAKDQTNPRAGIKTADDQFYDPWGVAYAISIDANYDNQVPNPYAFHAGSAALRHGVIAWSFGRDKLSQSMPGPAADKSTGPNNDDVISWQ